MTRQRLFWMSTACEGAFMPKLPVIDIDWRRLRPA